MWLRLRCWQQYFAFPYWFFTIIIAVNKIIISLDINENNKFCVLRLVIISLSITINILVVRTLFLDSTWRSMLYFLSQILQESCIQSLFCICMIRMLFVFKILKYFLKSIHWKRLWFVACKNFVELYTRLFIPLGFKYLRLWAVTWKVVEVIFL